LFNVFEEQTAAEHIAEFKKENARDFLAEQALSKQYQGGPIQWFYGLNRFQYFQGIHNFMRSATYGLLGWLPIFRSRETYIHSTFDLTRYRNYNDSVV